MPATCRTRTESPASRGRVCTGGTGFRHPQHDRRSSRPDGWRENSAGQSRGRDSRHAQPADWLIIVRSSDPVAAWQFGPPGACGRRTRRRRPSGAALGPAERGSGSERQRGVHLSARAEPRGVRSGPRGRTRRQAARARSCRCRRPLAVLHRDLVPHQRRRRRIQRRPAPTGTAPGGIDTALIGMPAMPAGVIVIDGV